MSRWFSIVAFSLMALLTLHCATQSKKSPPAGVATVSPTSTLSQIDAIMRAKQVSDVNYELEFDLTQSGDRYSGRQTITFNSTAPGRDLRIDFAEGQVTRLAMNGKPIEFTNLKFHFVVPGKEITKGPQKLEIDFTQEYSRQGRGITRVIDPIDKQPYLYSDFEPYDASRAFPCFDQPDLKATYTLKVLAPKTWQVISSTRESEVQNDPSGSKRWIFPRSARFSTYIFSMHAGPYAKWEDSKFRIPLRLFARKSLAKHVHPEEWFPITRHGFDFMEKYFSTPYPYKKYDQIVVPEFNAGAMENVAAVTFTERFIATGAKTRNQKRALSITILHEMAHMWFGDLVTMRWWGDLWLNESFATYMSSVAMAASPEFPEAWHQFFAGKTGAYYEDQMVTTHPVVAKVNDTNEAFTAFDSITYGKGAAVLKQLSYTIGEDNFKKGLKIYFDRYAEKNTEYRDFMNAMAEASGKNLDAWQKQWFETAGVNSISAQFDCKDGKISQFAILQTAPTGDSVMRSHAFEIGLMSRANGVVKVDELLRVDITEPTTYVSAAVGKPCPHVVYPNVGDFGYLKARLDDRSVNNLKYSLNEIQDPMLRHQLWYAMWDKVRDGEFSFLAFSDLLVPEAIAKESNDLIIRLFAQAAGQIQVYFSQTPSLKDKEYGAYNDRLEREVWKRLRSAKSGSNDQMVWFDWTADFSQGRWGLEQVKGVLNGREKLAGLKVDQDRRWRLIRALSEYNDPDAEKIIEAEAKRDTSSQGVEERIANLASRPIYENKMKWVEEYKLSKSSYSFSQLKSALFRLFPASQLDLKQQFSQQFFTDLVDLNKSKDNFVVGVFTRLAPYECSAESAGKIKEFLSKTASLQPVVIKNLKLSAQEGERCRNVVAFAEKTNQAPAPAR